jgi:hypothetical protein
MNITEKFDDWAERSPIQVRLELYGEDKRERCNLVKLNKVFELAKRFHVSQPISTNLNQFNATYITLDNYVLRHRNSDYLVNWGNHWGFLLALITEFEHVYIDPPEDGNNVRLKLGKNGEIIEIIETWDDV